MALLCLECARTHSLPMHVIACIDVVNRVMVNAKHPSLGKSCIAFARSMKLGYDGVQRLHGERICPAFACSMSLGLELHTGARPSISSKKMMAGCWRWASSKSMRSWRSASPTHLLSTSAPLRIKNATLRPARLALAASARATSVLPVPAWIQAS